MRANYRYPAKPIDRPDHISVLMPTRGRPDGLTKVFESFQKTVERKDLLDIWIYVDDDDTLTLDYIESGKWNIYGIVVNWHIAKSAGSMGDMLNQLWQACTTNPGLYFPFSDDYTISTPHWDSLLRRAFSQFEDGVMLGFLPDNTVRPHQVTFAIPSSRWLNLLGYFLTNRFYFWFDDQWIDEIGQMVGRKVMIPIRLENPVGRGKTPRMRRLPFWARYFNLTLEDRYQDALTILRTLHGNDEQKFAAAHERALAVAGHLVNIFNSHSDAIYAQMESSYRDSSDGIKSSKLGSYLKTELSAVEDLLTKLAYSCTHANHEEITDLADSLSLASFRAAEVDYLKASALFELGCIAEAEAALASCQAARGDTQDIQPLKSMIQSQITAPNKSFYASRSELRLPSWLTMKEPRDILFPANIPQELFYAIQRLLYQENIETILDIGAGDGTGSTRAAVETLDGRQRKIFCIEPDTAKCEQIRRLYSDRVTVYCGSSVALDQYITEAALTSFYSSQPSILNYYPLDTIIQWYRDERAALTEKNFSNSCIEEIRHARGIEFFDMAILDGSLFTGQADLNAVYGARFLALNHVRSIKNFSNMLRLLADPNYQVIELNYQTGCGHAVFRRKS